MTIVLPSTNDGRVHRTEIMQEDAQIPDLATAQSLAAVTDIFVGNTTPTGTGKYGTFPDDMVTVNADGLILTYQKAAVWAGTPAHDFPERWYAHSAAVGAVANRVNSPQGATFWIMQPDSYTASYTDTGNLAGGGAAAVYVNWRAFNAAKIANEIVSYNGVFPGDPLQGAWLDTMGPSLVVGQNVPGTSTKYTAATWEAAVNPVAPIVKAALPAGMFCFGNGGSSPNLYQFVDGVMFENWIRTPTTAALPTGCPTDANFQSDINSMITPQVNGVVAQPYSKLWSSMTLVQQAAWQRFLVASYLIGNRGKMFFGLNMHGASDSSQPAADLNPWDPSYFLDPAYFINFGTPLDTFGSASLYRLQQRPVSLGWLYGRRFQNGLALINLDANSQNWTLDRTYTELDGTPVSPGTAGAILGAAPKIRSPRTDRAAELTFLDTEIPPNKFGSARIYNDCGWSGPNAEEAQILADGRTMCMSINASAGGTQWLHTDVTAGVHDATLITLANAVKATGKQFILAYTHEPENSVHTVHYASGQTKAQKAAQFKAAYTHVINLFAAHSVTNVSWALILEAFTYTSTSSNYPPSGWDPGPTLIDYYAGDGYCWWTKDAQWKTFAQVFQNMRDWLAANRSGSSALITEVGVEEDTTTPLPLRKAQWITAMLTTLKSTGWEMFKGVYWFNSLDPTAGYVWYFDSTSNSTAAFKAIANDTYFSQFGQSAGQYMVPGKSAVLLKTTSSPTIDSGGPLAVTASGSIGISATQRTRMSDVLSVSGAGAVTVLGVGGAQTSGPLAVAGAGAVGISGSLEVNLTGGISVAGSGSVTVPVAYAIKSPGALAVSGSGAVAISDTRRIRISDVLTVAGTGAATVSATWRMRLSGLLDVTGAGVPAISAVMLVRPTGLLDVTGAGVVTIIATSPDVLSGKLSVAGSGAVAVSDSREVVLSSLLAVAGSGQVSTLGGGLLVSTGLLGVSGANLVALGFTPTIRVCGPLDLTGTGAVTIPLSAKIINGSGLLAVTGSAALAVSDSRRVRMSDVLAVAGSGAVTVDTLPIRTSDVLSVSGSGVVTVSDSFHLSVAGALAVSGAGSVQLVAATIIGQPAEIASGVLAVAGSGSAAISDSRRVRMSDVLSVAGAGAVLVTTLTAINSGLLDVTGAGLVLATAQAIIVSDALSVSGEGSIEHSTDFSTRTGGDDSLLQDEAFIKRFFH